MRLIATTLLGCAAACVAGRAAQAQPIVIGEDVADRAHPEYTPLPVPFGSFLLYPTLSAAASFNDNVRAVAGDAQARLPPFNLPARQSDLAFDFRPEVKFRSRFARHSLNGNVFFDQTLYTRLTNQNASNYGVNASGVLDLSAQSQIQGEFVAERRSENLSSLGSFRGANVAARYDHFGARVTGSHAVGDVTLKVTGSVQRYSFHDFTALDITTNLPRLFSQQYRNVTQFDATGSVGYRISPAVGLIGTVQYDYRRYDVRPGSPLFNPLTSIDRTSSGVTVQGGVTLELSSLVFGTIQAGYFTSNYRDPSLRDPAGFNVDADVLWNVTPLTSVKLHAARSVQDSASRTFAGNTRFDLALAVNHELYRYILLQGDIGYGHFSPNGNTAALTTRFPGNEYTFGAGVRYLVSRAVTVNASVRRSQRDTADPFSRYKQFVARIGVAYTL